MFCVLNVYELQEIIAAWRNWGLWALTHLLEYWLWSHTTIHKPLFLSQFSSHCTYFWEVLFFLKKILHFYTVGIRPLEILTTDKLWVPLLHIYVKFSGKKFNKIMLVVKGGRKIRWQLEGKVESWWEKSQPIYVPVRMMQDGRLIENTGERGRVSGVRSLNRQEGIQMVVSIN